MDVIKFMKRCTPLIQYSVVRECQTTLKKPHHLICFKQWTTDMVLEIINSAINLKCRHTDTHGVCLDTLKGSNILLLEEGHEPFVSMAVCKAAQLLGATNTHIMYHLEWDTDYVGKVFSSLADLIFVLTSTHWCLQRLADQSRVPVMCMRSRSHATIQAMATVMSIYEEFGSMHDLNVAWLGHAHPVLNSYLLLCPMLMANVKFKCGTKTKQFSPLLLKASEQIADESHTTAIMCDDKADLLLNAAVIISGPHSEDKDEKHDFTLTEKEIDKYTKCKWIYFHTFPRGQEIPDELFLNPRARSFDAFNNMQFIAAALMLKGIKGSSF